LHVLIIGGGIGGLALAQGLKKIGVNVSIYERDKSSNFRPQGYRIHINPDGTHALYENLPRSLFNLYLATCNVPGFAISAYDENLRQIAEMKYSDKAQDDPSRRSTAVNRLTLREVLLGGLDDVVKYDKSFVRYEQLDGGAVRAHFADGTIAEGDLLVAADGTNSPVRKQFLPKAKVLDMGLCCIYGRMPIDNETKDWLPSFFYRGMTAVMGLKYDKQKLLLATASYRKREEFQKARQEVAPEIHVSNVEDYFIWSLILHQSDLPMSEEQFHRASPEDLYELARKFLSQSNPVLRHMVDKSDHAATFPITLRSAERVRPWKTTNITFVGDSIHTMTPAGGVGANTALRDAELLTKKIGEAAAGKKPLLQAVSEYEEQMRDYGFKAVASSLRQFRSGFGNMLGGPIRQAFSKFTLRILNLIFKLRG
jgi:2-polyprenyl-6-methoxyphenol hydroxylase-like FAD-dependent oxidoreductase